MASPVKAATRSPPDEVNASCADALSGALLEAWRALGGESPTQLDIDGETVFPDSPFALGEIATAAIGVALLAAAELAEARCGHRPKVALDARHASLAFISERLLRSERELPPGFAALSRFAPTSDGHIRLHANYPHHRAALLEALGDPGDDGEALAAIRAREAVELEQGIVAAGGAAAAVRTHEQWLAHPQARANAGRTLPSVEAGDKPAPRLPDGGALPASGIRVLDLTRVIAGPVGTRMLAALGAHVLRVDPPHIPELELQVLDGAVGKRSALIDLSASAEREALEALLASADVLVQGYRPGALAAFALDPAALAERHPQLVTVTLSAWGEEGPWAKRRGFDSLVQAACGIALACGTAEEPGALPAQALDHASGYLIAAAALRGLTMRARIGRAGHARVALARTAAWLMHHPGGRRGGAAAWPAPAEIDRYMVEVDAGGGRLGCLAPPGSLDGRPLSWPRGVATPGADAPAWDTARA
jgi:crotonobetainyl-CoA:carnitine CoA-transferase CaiB-like acyl-CoA transferase